MRDQDRMIVTSLVLLMLAVWLGFFFHREPRFAGSLYGGMLGVSGVILMLVPLAVYSMVKRVAFIKQRVTSWVSLKTFLAVHIYTALVGSIFVLLHTGQKFNSPLGILLTATVLLVTLSGFTGRYLMSHIKLGLREKQEMLKQLQREFEQVSYHSLSSAAVQPLIQSKSGQLEDWLPRGGQTEVTLPSVTTLVSAIADLEYSILVHSWMTNWFQRWLRFHLVISGILVTLLTYHIWSGVYYGLRWFQ